MRRLQLALCLVLLACTDSQGGAALPDDAVVLPGNQANLVLHQCSRPVPVRGAATWQPSPADIAALEAALPAALATQNPPGAPDWSPVPEGWRRQYVGLVRGGRRFLYGNFYPRSADNGRPDPEQWRREPVMVCDGGPIFFGVEYDVEAGRFTHFGFNGGPA